jgi:hypothetical protein
VNFKSSENTRLLAMAMMKILPIPYSTALPICLDSSIIPLSLQAINPSTSIFAASAF